MATQRTRCHLYSPSFDLNRTSVVKVCFPLASVSILTMPALASSCNSAVISASDEPLELSLETDGRGPVTVVFVRASETCVDNDDELLLSCFAAEDVANIGVKISLGILHLSRSSRCTCSINPTPKACSNR